MADIMDEIRDWILGKDDEIEAMAPTVKKKELNTDKQKIVEIVDDLTNKNIVGVPVQDIVREAKKIGIDEEITRSIVDELVRDGYLIRPHYMSDMVRLYNVHDFSPASEDFPS